MHPAKKVFMSVGALGAFALGGSALANATTGSPSPAPAAETRERLFERGVTGITLTAEGQRYVDACRAPLAEIAQAESLVAGATARARATVVVGVQPVLATNCVMPALTRFHSMHPQIAVDLREFSRPTPKQMNGIDVVIVIGWPEVKDLVHRQIAHCRYVVCASPEFWAANPKPVRPRDLAGYECLTIRSVNGPVMDWWSFRRGDEQEDVAVSGWLTANNAHRDLVLGAALAGGGIVRTIDVVQRRDLHAGRLVPVLTDWESTEVPPINLLYGQNARRSAHVRAFIEFAVRLFAELEAEANHRVVASGRPAWIDTTRARTSAARWRKPTTPRSR